MALPVPITSFIGPFISAGRFVTGWLRKPMIEFHPPENTAQEDHLVWWHIPVSLKRGLLKPLPLQDASVEMVLTGDGSKTLQMCWRSWEGPKHRITLFEGEIYHIPVVARTMFVSHMLATTSGMVIPPEVHPKWIIRSGIPRISDVNHCFTYTGVTDLVAPGHYRATVKILVGSKVIATHSYRISIPPPNSPNSEFTFKSI